MIVAPGPGAGYVGSSMGGGGGGGIAAATVLAEEQAATQVVEMPGATMAAPMVSYAAPTVTYMQPQPTQYVTADGQPLQDVMEQPVQYVTADGQYVMEQPVQYVTADGQTVSYVDPGAVYEYAAPARQSVQQPSVFNVSPDTFAKLAQGGALTQEELDGMMGATAPVPVEVAAVTAVAEAPAAGVSEVVSEATQAVTSATTSKKEKSSKKKALSSKKKKSKGCC